MMREILELEHVIKRSQEWFFSQQHPDGHWCAELEGDSLLQSEAILLLAYLGKEKNPLVGRLARHLLKTQGEDGGWAMFKGGPPSVHNTVKAYFALKIAGYSRSAPEMERARACVHMLGGADRVNSFTRFYLALLGQIPYGCCPTVPPELIFFPRWFPINIYALSSWTRTIVLPLSLVSSLQPVRHLPEEVGIQELFKDRPESWPPLRAPGKPENPGFFSWDTFFRLVDKGLKLYNRQSIRPFHRMACRQVEDWLWSHCVNSDGPGAIQPPILWGLVAMKALGYGEDHEKYSYFYQQLMDLVVEDPEEDTAHIQPCRSPVWDTVITLRALAAGGITISREEIGRAVEWLLHHQVLVPGDWSKTVKSSPGGWCFEYHNDFYPDCDDTAMSIMALHGVSVPEQSQEVHMAIQRGFEWLLHMQNRDGGWGAFDRNNNREFLTHVPFADHNAMIDPSTPDLTARLLEMFGTLGYGLDYKPVSRAVKYIRKSQLPDGSWFGRWGVNYIYGTGEVLCGLCSVGLTSEDKSVRRGAQWLLAHQDACGGWGETPLTYDDPEIRGRGPVTASQTAWALLGLISAGYAQDESVKRGIFWLTEHNTPSGNWIEPEFTGTGFPRVFYLRYHYYAQYFPLMALSRYMKCQASMSGEGRDR